MFLCVLSVVEAQPSAGIGRASGLGELLENANKAASTKAMSHANKAMKLARMKSENLDDKEVCSGALPHCQQSGG